MRSLKIVLLILVLLLGKKTLVLGEVQETQSGEGTKKYYLIKVDFSEFRLTLFELEKENYNELMNFKVCLPMITPQLPIRGWIVDIQENPYWYPGYKAKRSYLKKGVELPDVVSPGHPHNAMGAAKFIIEFETLGADPTSRIHGTNDKNCLGKRVTLNCIRILNEEITGLVKFLKDKIQSKNIEVLYVK